jgi:hypothetical protein
MTDVALPALEGTNPLGFLAALGVVDALASENPDAKLRWTDELVPHAVIGGITNLDLLLDALDRDREHWQDSAVLNWPEGAPLPDAKPREQALREWFEAAAGYRDHRAGSDLLCALVAEGALDRSGKAKPTHLHFTAGRQQFLNMVRELAAEVDRERLREAVRGPWRYDSRLPSLSWDARGERIYAIRAVNPANEKRPSVPGADWLAFRGLIFYPVTRASNGSLRTPACDPQWKRSAFRWPLWTVSATRNVIKSLVADQTLVSQSRRNRLRSDDLTARGILSVLESPIRRNDQGGYGSFGGPDILAAASRPGR